MRGHWTDKPDNIKESKRAIRRHHRDRLIKRVKKIWRDCWGGSTNRKPNAAQKGARSSK